MFRHLTALGRRVPLNLSLATMLAVQVAACGPERTTPPSVQEFASRVHVENGEPGRGKRAVRSWVDWERTDIDHGEEPVRVALIAEEEHGDVIKLYVANLTRTGGLRFNEATADGRKINMEVISRDEQICRLDDCEILEEVSIAFTGDELAGASETGLTIEILGVLGNVSFKLPGYAIEGFLQRYREA